MTLFQWMGSEIPVEGGDKFSKFQIILYFAQMASYISLDFISRFQAPSGRGGAINLKFKKIQYMHLYFCS